MGKLLPVHGKRNAFPCRLDTAGDSESSRFQLVNAGKRNRIMDITPCMSHKNAYLSGNELITAFPP